MSQTAVALHDLLQRNESIEEVLLAEALSCVLVHIRAGREHLPGLVEHVVQWTGCVSAVADQGGTFVIAAEWTRLAGRGEGHLG